MKNALLWLLLSLIWSTSYLVIKLGVAGIGPLSLVALRMLIGTSVMAVVLAFTNLKLPRDPWSWWVLFISGLFGNILPFSLITYGEIHVDSGFAALTMGIAPVVTVLLAPLIHAQERLTARAVLGIIVGFVGLLVLFGPEVLSGIGVHVMGQLAVLGGALCYAFTTLFARRYANQPPLVMATGSMLVGTVMIVMAAVIFEAPFEAYPPSQTVLLAALYLGLLPNAAATLIYFYLLPRLGAARLSQVNFVVPVAGVLIGAAVLGEVVSLNTLAALSLIVLAVFLVTYRKAS